MAMDNLEKLRILLQHWIDHNGGHVAEFSKWQGVMNTERQDAVAAFLGEAIKQMDSVSETLAEALKACGGPADPGEGHEHHHHHHHHD
jgi:hypothetical protein